MTNARERLAKALDLLPDVKTRLASGQQPNAYESGGGFIVGIGPVTNCLALVETGTEEVADMFEQALRVALLSDQPHPSVATGHPEQGALLSEGESMPWNDLPEGTALSRYIIQDHEGYGLHPRTACLVRSFAGALGRKLRKAEKKYGYSDGWRSPDWEAECQQNLADHMLKGDPLDVAAFAAFCWFHHWPTVPADGSGHCTESTTDASQASGKTEDLRALLSDQPHPSVATGHPEQGALLSGWQPIETAPKDGSHILIAIGSDYIGSAFYADDDSDPYPWKFFNRNGIKPLANGIRDDLVGPTHWMPLPSPPRATNSNTQTKGGE
jgi:hypothetical protein